MSPPKAPASEGRATVTGHEYGPHRRAMFARPATAKDIFLMPDLADQKKLPADIVREQLEEAYQLVHRLDKPKELTALFGSLTMHLDYIPDYAPRLSMRNPLNQREYDFMIERLEWPFLVNDQLARYVVLSRAVRRPWKQIIAGAPFKRSRAFLFQKWAEGTNDIVAALYEIYLASND
jgi:hypothetical protein